MLFKLGFLALLFLFELNSRVSSSCTYTVRYGDICNTIASRSGIQVSELFRLNPFIANPACNNLVPGQVLNLCTSYGDFQSQPSNQGSVVTCSSYYTIRYGDTCNQITQSFGINFNYFMKLNKNLKCSYLVPGQRVCIGSNTLPSYTKPSCEQTRRVTVYDTCQSLERSYAAFYAMNPGIDCSNLQDGQEICIQSRQVQDQSNSFTANTASSSIRSVTTKTTTTPATTQVNRPLYKASVYCLDKHLVRTASQTCNSIVKTFGLNYNSFITINPNIKCETIRVGDELCLKAVNSPLYRDVKCLSQLKISPYYQCEILVKFYPKFLEYNPGINCDNLQYDQYVCIFAI